MTEQAATEQATIIETLTGVEDLVSSAGLPLFLPTPEYRQAALATNKADGLIAYKLPPDTSVTPAKSAHTVIYSSNDGSADAFQATALGQVRQAVVLPTGTTRFDRAIQLYGGISVTQKAGDQFVVNDNLGRPVGFIDNFQVRSADGAAVPATLTIAADTLSVSVAEPTSSPVYATWSFAAASDAAEVILE